MCAVPRRYRQGRRSYIGSLTDLLVKPHVNRTQTARATRDLTAADCCLNLTVRAVVLRALQNSDGLRLARELEV